MADLKITELTEETTPVAGDMIPIVTDIATTAVTKRVNVSTLIPALCMAKAYPNADISLTSTTDTKVTAQTELYDVGGGYDAANSKFVVPSGKAGYYEVIAHVYMYSGTGSSLGYCVIKVNGSGVSQKVDVAVGVPDARLAIWIGHLDATDYVEMYAQKNASSWKVYGDSANTWFSIRQLTQD